MLGTRPVRRLLVAALAAGLALAGVVAPAAPASAATLPGGAYVFAGLQGQLAAIDRVTGQVVASVDLPDEPAGWLLPLAGLLLVGGALAVLATRRRRTGEGA